jgi:CelD/BcsL family acetyltransferase involved in cellulose biosynthesis
MNVYSLDPLRDPRWPEFIRRHPRASVFHTPGWLRALQRTYHYQPVAFTTSAPTEVLGNAHLFCTVHSWLTGRRLVSLPFSDHCEPLVENAQTLNELCRFVRDLAKERRWKYVEMRWRSSGPPLAGTFQTARTFYAHRLDLRPHAEALFRSFHRDSVQRKVRRAEREGLTYEAGRSQSLLDKLCGLLRLTRRRHGIPLQPLEWFRNLVDGLGEDACIRIASRHDQPVAGILTLRHATRMVYKYGGSDPQWHNLGGMALLLWNAIQEAKRTGVEEFDFGRSDCDNSGLIAFKEHWAAQRSTLTYWRFPAPAAPVVAKGWRIQLARQVSGRLPNGVLSLAGKLLYRHIG